MRRSDRRPISFDPGAPSESVQTMAPSSFLADRVATDAVDLSEIASLGVLQNATRSSPPVASTSSPDTIDRPLDVTVHRTGLGCTMMFISPIGLPASTGPTTAVGADGTGATVARRRLWTSSCARTGRALRCRRCYPHRPAGSAEVRRRMVAEHTT